MTSLIDKILACHEALESASLPHAFGGALALAWCTGQARATIDIDLNVFCGGENIGPLLAALPEEITVRPRDKTALRRDLQVRLWWEHTPVDLFLNSSSYHTEVAKRVSRESFAGSDIPFLSCNDLAVFKIWFNRTKDWADLETMVLAKTVNIDFVRGVIEGYLGQDTERLERLDLLVGDID